MPGVEQGLDRFVSPVQEIQGFERGLALVRGEQWREGVERSKMFPIVCEAIVNPVSV